MVWLADPFSYFKDDHDVYFTDDMALVCSTLFDMLLYDCGPLRLEHTTSVITDTANSTRY